MTKHGKITGLLGGFYYVSTGDETVECRARGRFRKDRVSPLVGDMVEISQNPDGSGYIKEIAPRKNFLIRPPISNLDNIVIVASEADPVTDVFLIDKITVVAEKSNISIIIVVNKTDLKSGDNIYETYKACGFNVLRASCISGDGVNELKDALRGKISALTGNSGVGKSSILNMLYPDVLAQVGDINQKIGRGRHTTRAVEIIACGGETYIADTPGF